MVNDSLSGSPPPKFLGVETRGSVISIVIYHHYRGFELVVGEGSGRAYLLGFTVGCISYNVITISYLLFADNMSIFCEVDYEQMWDLNSVCVCVYKQSLV